MTAPLTTPSDREYVALARIKKPHRLFNAGDLIVGEVRDGCANRLLCWGWSSKQNRIIGGRWGYSLRYQGSKPLKDVKKWEEARRGAGRGDLVPRIPSWRDSGAGYLRIIKWFSIELEDRDPSPQLRDEAWLGRLLIELSCGNMPKCREAAPSLQIFKKHRSP